MWPNRIDSQTYPARSFISCGSNIDSNKHPYSHQPPASRVYMYKTATQISSLLWLHVQDRTPNPSSSPNYVYRTASPDYMYKTRFPPIPTWLHVQEGRVPKYSAFPDYMYKTGSQIAALFWFCTQDSPPPSPTNLQSFFITHAKHTESPATPDYAD